LIQLAQPGMLDSERCSDGQGVGAFGELIPCLKMRGWSKWRVCSLRSVSAKGFSPSGCSSIWLLCCFPCAPNARRHRLWIRAFRCSASLRGSPPLGCRDHRAACSSDPCVIPIDARHESHCHFNGLLVKPSKGRTQRHLFGTHRSRQCRRSNRVAKKVSQPG